jgi:hypothetical protein
LWATYVVLGLGLLAFVWQTGSAQAALAAFKPVLVIWAALAAVALICEVLEDRQGR